MKIQHLAAVVAACILPAIAPFAHGQADFSRTATFGDSLTGNDLVFLAYETPYDLYGADPAEAAFAKAAQPGALLSNFAVPGSESSLVPAQVLLHAYLVARGRIEPPTFVSLETGGNDIRNQLSLLRHSAPGGSREADRVSTSIAVNIWRSILRLRYLHPDVDILVWTVPDLTQTPSVLQENLSPEETIRVRAHIERVNRFIRWLGRFDGIAVFDAYALLSDLAAQPPVILGQELVGAPFHGGYDHVFADELHPTAVGNALIANAIIDVLAIKWGNSIPYYSEEELASLARLTIP